MRLRLALAFALAVLLAAPVAVDWQISQIGLQIAFELLLQAFSSVGSELKQYTL